MMAYSLSPPAWDMLHSSFTDKSAGGKQTIALLFASFVAVVITGTLSLLRFLYDLLFGPLKDRPLKDEKAHGGAGKATQAEAKAAARGRTSKPPWADHGYND